MSVEGLEDLEEVEEYQEDTGGSSSSSEEEVIITKRVRKKKKKPLPIPPEPITEEMKNAVIPTKNTKNFKIVDGKNHSEDEDDKEIQKPKPYKKAGANDGRKKKERTPAQVKAWEKALEKRAENRRLRAEEREQQQTEIKENIKKKRDYPRRNIRGDK